MPYYLFVYLAFNVFIDNWRDSPSVVQCAQIHHIGHQCHPGGLLTGAHWASSAGIGCLMSKSISADKTN